MEATPAGSSLPVEYRLNPAVSNDDLNALFAAAWPERSCTVSRTPGSLRRAPGVSRPT